MAEAIETPSTSKPDSIEAEQFDNVDGGAGQAQRKPAREPAPAKASSKIHSHTVLRPMESPVSRVNLRCNIREGHARQRKSSRIVQFFCGAADYRAKR